MKGRARRPAVDEWVGGILSMPATVTGEGEPYRPDMLIWVDPSNELILGMTVARPGEIPALAAEHLRETIASPAAGPSGAPGRVRVTSASLGEALRAAFPRLEIVVGATPEIDAVGTALAERFGGDEPDPSWLDDGLPIEAVGRFFEAMAALRLAEPWAFVLQDEALFSVTIEALDVRDAVAVVIGQMGESMGVLLFADLDDHDRFVASGEALQRGDMHEALDHGGEPDMPAHLGLSFDAVEEVAPTLRAERDANGWMLADEDAFPSLLCFEANLRERAPTARDLAVAEALARAFSAAPLDDDPFDATRPASRAFEQTLTVATHGGEVEVTLHAPVRDGADDGRAGGAIPDRVYRLKIELERVDGEAPDAEVSRTVECAADHTLWDLHGIIQDTYGWDDDHLFSFFVSGRLRDRKSEYPGSPMGDVASWSGDAPSVEETRLEDLGLKPRRVMRYVFDEHIVHKITVSTIRDGSPDDTDLPRVVGAVGEAPPQYGAGEDDREA